MIYNNCTGKIKNNFIWIDFVNMVRFYIKTQHNIPI